MTWLAESIHFVVFSTPSPTPEAFNPWLRVFGSPPPNLQQNQPGTPPGGQASGVVGPYAVTINVQPGRTELVLTPSEANGPAPGVFDDTNDPLTTLKSYAEKLATKISVLRLAIIINLSEQAADGVAAGKIFENNLKAVPVPPGAVDLAYALNVPCDSPVPGTAINRLCRWGTGVRQVVQVQMNSFAAGSIPQFTVSENHAAFLNIDVNTAPRSVPFAPGEVTALVAALDGEGRAIISEGLERLSTHD